MYNILRFHISSFTASNYNTTFSRFIRNPSKRAGGIKSLKNFKIENLSEIDEDDDSFNLQDAKRQIRNNDLAIEETLEKGEDMEAIITETGKLYHKELSEEKSQKMIMKKKLIGRKYFNEGKETCLLTHAAKEQIRYLHKLNPLDWTPEVLSKSFPISVDGVKKLLKSYFTLKDPVKIKEHDENVKRKWESLQSGKPSDDIHFHTQCLWNESKILKENYNGNQNLPQAFNSNKQKVKEITKKKPIGEYSALLKNYIEYKYKTETGQKSNSELMVSTKNYQNKREMAKNDRENLDFIRKSKLYREEGWHRKRDLTDECELPFNQFKKNVEHQFKNERKKSSTSEQYHKWIEQDLEKKDMKNPSNFYNTKDFVSKIPKYSKENIELKRVGNKSDSTTYLFDEKTGYQHPVGRTFKGKISIPSKIKKSKSLYKVNQCVYDENGEFLYKLPG